jgi:hypothetical protein
METNEEFQYGDVLVEIGKTAKWVVVAFASNGQVTISKVVDGCRLMEWGRCIFPEDEFIKVGRWDFTNKCEIDYEVY